MAIVGAGRDGAGFHDYAATCTVGASVVETITNLYMSIMNTADVERGEQFGQVIRCGCAPAAARRVHARKYSGHIA